MQPSSVREKGDTSKLALNAKRCILILQLLGLKLQPHSIENLSS